MALSRILILVPVLSLLLLTKTYASGMDQDSVVYVWDFKPNPASIQDIAAQLTNDFETELINLGFYTVLERRKFNRVLSHQDLERSISNMDQVPDSSKLNLRAQQAQVVIFGEVTDDINSGVYEVVVTFQKLNAELIKKESILIGRGLIMDNQTRKEKMKELLVKLHRKEFEEAKMEQFEWISNILSSYIVRTKNVQKEFQDMAHAAFDNEQYFNQLNNTIIEYNKVFEDINDNHVNYQMDFSKNWGAPESQELGNIFRDILNDIHKSHILRLDKIRIEMWDYWQLSNQQKKKVKKEKILDSVETITRDLQTQISITEIEVSNFLSDLRNGFN